MKTTRLSAAGCLLLTIVLALALAACSSAQPESPVGETGSPVSNAGNFPNDQAAYDFFVSKGLTSFQAAGIVGNLDQESGVDPTSQQYGGGPGRGIAQWEVGGRWDTYSGDNAVEYAGQLGQSVWSLGLQLDFVWYELTTFSWYGLGALRATTNVTDATIAFENDFEGCGQCDQSQRIAYAQAVLAAFGGSAANGTGAPSGTCTASEVSNASDRGAHFWTCEYGGFRYLCDDRNGKVSEVCPSGCTTEGVDADDQCNGAPQPQCTAQEIANQSAVVNGINASFWTCEGNSRYVCDAQGNKVAEVCAAGCSPQGAATDDLCGCSAQLTAGAMMAGGNIRSCDGRFTFAMQGDGNLVLYKGTRPLWASNTWHSAARYATMQGDGNLVLYDPSHHPVWASHTNRHPGAYLVVQNDGNVVIYQGHTPLWATNTAGR
jgi:hypothetical protein